MKAERWLHQALKERGHRRQDGSCCGRQWFLHRPAPLDALARELRVGDCVQPRPEGRGIKHVELPITAGDSTPGGRY
jgi:hypothetical protein